MRFFAAFLFLMIAGVQSAWAGGNVFKTECREEVVNMCQGPSAESLGICSLLVTEKRDSLESMYLFLREMIEISESSRRVLVCARLIGQLFSVEGTAELRRPTGPSSPLVGDFVVTKPSYAFDGRKITKYFQFSWHAPLDTDPATQCVFAAQQELSDLGKSVRVDVTTVVTSRIANINLLMSTNPNYFRIPLEGQVSLDVVSVDRITTNFSENGMEGTCQVLRQMVMEERNRLLNIGL